MNKDALNALDLGTRIRLGGTATQAEVEELVDYVEKLEEDQVTEDLAADKLAELRGEVVTAMTMLEELADREAIHALLEKAWANAQ